MGVWIMAHTWLVKADLTLFPIVGCPAILKCYTGVLGRAQLNKVGCSEGDWGEKNDESPSQIVWMHLLCNFNKGTLILQHLPYCFVTISTTEHYVIWKHTISSGVSVSYWKQCWFITLGISVYFRLSFNTCTNKNEGNMRIKLFSRFWLSYWKYICRLSFAKII